MRGRGEERKEREKVRRGDERWREKKGKEMREVRRGEERNV